MFDRILIANRGEIACRVIRTCRRLGVRTVAVFSDADRDALHVALADEALHVGPPPARDSYLNGAAILAAAHACGAEAIHPGYGFLSENADFAAACEQAGVVFIGPGADAIRAMGSKSAAKSLMYDAGVPLVPGYHGEDQDPSTLAAEAERIGYPLLIKATSGGGGKGMRRVDATAEFDEALAAARRESAAAFGDERVLLERYVQQPRHIEVQVFADNHGHSLHLFERDCSIQRRHQKIIEEAPAPGLSPDLRERMGATAVAAASAIGYRGAGTVEFIADQAGDFFFMEMNTRLQVEHPVTEMITGRDLVAWQLRVAAGEPLPCRQSDLRVHGHAIEARVYAEDPARNFMPATGTIAHLREPALPDTRIDSGVRAHDTITHYYDPMIAKLVAWGEDRPTALRHLRQLLAEYQLVGPISNLAFLGRIAGHAEFAAAHLTTEFVDRHRDELLPPPAPVPTRILVAAALSRLHEEMIAARRFARRSTDPYSPWQHTDGWQSNARTARHIELLDGEQSYRLSLTPTGAGDYQIRLADDTTQARLLSKNKSELRLEVDGTHFSVTVIARGGRMTLLCDGGEWTLHHHDPLAAALQTKPPKGSLNAPLPGAVIEICVAEGDHVQAGQALVLLEAMKMEYTIRADGDGTVEHLRVAVGDQVSEGAELLTLDAD